MRIIHIVHAHCSSERQRQIKNVVKHLCTEQNQHDCCLEVWVIGSGYRYGDDFEQTNIRTFSALKNGMFVDSDIKKAIGLLEQDAVIHFHDGFHLDYFALAKLFKLNGHKIFLTPYNSYSSSEINKGYVKKKVYFDFFEKGLLDRCNMVFCTSEIEKEHLLKLTPELLVGVIPHGYDLDLEVSSTPNESTPVFLYKGELTEYTFGLDLLLLGFMKYRQWLKGKGKLRFIGEGFFENRIVSLANEHNLKDVIEIYHNEEAMNSKQLVVESDVFFLTNRKENVSSDALEAASLGVPLAVSGSGGLSEYVSRYRSGVVLKKNSIDEIALTMKKIEHLKASKSNELLQMQVNAVHMIEQEFNWSMISSRVVNAYLSC